MLFHVSEETHLDSFIPRASVYTDAPVVWAINADRLHNYLLPRDCPRVTYYAGVRTTQTDVKRFLGTSASVVAVESVWWDRLLSCRLFVYHLPSVSFQ